MAKPGVPGQGGDYAPLPAMTFILAKVAEQSITMKAFKEGEKEKPQLSVIFDAISYKDEDDEKVDVSGSRIWFFGGVSLHEKAKLRPLALAVMPENTTTDVLTEEQKADPNRAPNLFEDFDTDMLDGKYVYVIGELNADGYLKPTGFKRVKKQPQEAAPVAAAPKAEKAKKASDEDDI